MNSSQKEVEKYINCRLYARYAWIINDRPKILIRTVGGMFKIFDTCVAKDEITKGPWADKFGLSDSKRSLFKGIFFKVLAVKCLEVMPNLTFGNLSIHRVSSSMVPEKQWR